jgi:FkbM family methyltransferase
MSILTLHHTPYQQTIQCFEDYIYEHSLKKNKLWEEIIVNTIILHLQPNTDFLDIGANIGLISLGVHLKAKQNQLPIQTIHCFECNTNTFNLLRNNTSQLPNIHLYPFAISNQYELCHMTYISRNIGGNFIHRTLNQQEDTSYIHPCAENMMNDSKQNNMFLPAIPLDSILYQFKNKISVIKIDVEGFEYNVISGAIQLIQLYRPILIIEIWARNIEKITSLLHQLNYHRIQKILPNDSYDENYISAPDEYIG